MKFMMNSTNWPKRLCSSFVCLLICFLLFACQTIQQIGSTTPKNEPTNTPVAQPDDKRINVDDLINLDYFKQNRNLWLEKKIVDYNLVMRLEHSGISAAASPVIIEIRNNKAVSIRAISKDDKRPVINYSDFDTVEKIFDQIQKDLDKRAEIRVVFNSEFGYPEYLKVNYAPTGAYAWFGLYIDKFEIVRGY